jgi:hypothetical protein
LLAATRTGKLQVRHLGSAHDPIVFEEDLAPLDPAPVPPPDWAQRW